MNIRNRVSSSKRVPHMLRCQLLNCRRPVELRCRLPRRALCRALPRPTAVANLPALLHGAAVAALLSSVAAAESLASKALSESLVPCHWDEVDPFLGCHTRARVAGSSSRAAPPAVVSLLGRAASGARHPRPPPAPSLHCPRRSGAPPFKRAAARRRRRGRRHVHAASREAALRGVGGRKRCGERETIRWADGSSPFPRRGRRQPRDVDGDRGGGSCVCWRRSGTERACVAAQRSGGHYVAGVQGTPRGCDGGGVRPANCVVCGACVVSEKWAARQNYGKKK